MKFRVTMKDPDTLYDAITDAVEEQLKSSEMPEDEQEAVHDLRVQKTKEIADEWFEYGEYLTVEIDTDTRTIRVVPANQLMG